MAEEKSELPPKTRRKRGLIRRVLFALSLVAVVAGLGARFWPIDRSELVAVAGPDGRVGMINLDGRVVIEPVWDDIFGEFDSGGMIIVKENGLYGRINKFGEVVIPTVWSELSQFAPDDLAAVTNMNGLTGWINRQGELVIPDKWNAMGRRFDSHGLLRVIVEEKVGWIGRDGEMVIPPEWDNAGGFDAEGRAAVKREGKWGWINTRGEEVIALSWDDVFVEIRDYDSDWIRYASPGILAPMPDDPTSGGRTVYFGTDGFAQVRVGNKWGCVDESGTMVIAPCSYDGYLQFDRNGYSMFSGEEGKFGWINNRGEVVIKPEWDSARDFDSEGMALVGKGEKYGWIDRDGKTAIALKWDNVGAFGESGLAPVMTGDKWGWINRHGQMVIEPMPIRNRGTENSPLNPYVPVLSFDDHGMTNVQIGKKWHCMNTDGEKAFEGDFLWLGLFDGNGLCFAVSEGPEVPEEHHDPDSFYQVHGELYLINRKGEVVIESPGTDWEWIRPYPGYIRSYFLLRGSIPPPRKAYVAISKEIEVPRMRREFMRLSRWVTGDETPVPDRESACIAYNTVGDLIWDSRWMRFETKCWLVIGLAGVALILSGVRVRKVGW